MAELFPLPVLPSAGIDRGANAVHHSDYVIADYLSLSLALSLKRGWFHAASTWSHLSDSSPLQQV